MEQNRLEAFEKMLSAVQEEYEGILSGMERMKAEKKTKTVTYQQLMARKLMYQNMLSMYQIYGLTSEQSGNLPGQPQAPEKESGWTCPECRRTFKKKGQSHYCGKAKESRKRHSRICRKSDMLSAKRCRMRRNGFPGVCPPSGKVTISSSLLVLKNISGCIRDRKQ